jgi:hypothetical protein
LLLLLHHLLQDGKLQLSTGLLSGLSAWSTRATASPEEQQLAAELLQDFGQYGPAPLKPGADEGQASVDCSSEPEPECRVVADKTMVGADVQRAACGTSLNFGPMLTPVFNTEWALAVFTAE